MKHVSVIAVCAAMAALILNGSDAIAAGREGVELCLRSAIPSLFPFFVLSAMLLPHASKVRLPFLSRMLGIPEGAESVFLLGALGGYPVGARCLCQACSAGALEKKQAEKMLGFCTNCGPSFLFGIVAAAFDDPLAGWKLWGIHIGSAILTGILFPSGCGQAQPAQMAPVSLPQAVRGAIDSMVSVCAWIILGKVTLALIPVSGLPVLISGLLELTGGCIALTEISDEGLRFITAAALVSFGGICVFMQVLSLCSEAGLSAGWYLPQKCVQALFSASLSMSFLTNPLLPAVFLLLPVLKFTIEKRKHMMYNTDSKGGISYVIPKKDAKVLSLLRLQHPS